MIDFDNIDFEELEQIPLPEGIEHRLYDRISQWAEDERKKKVRRLVWGRTIAVAASVAILSGIGFMLMNKADSQRCYISSGGETVTDENLVMANVESTMADIFSEDFPDVEEQMKLIMN